MALIKSIAGNEICDQTCRDAVNNISIGGRNLILNSAKTFGYSGFNGSFDGFKYETNWKSSTSYLSGLRGQRWTTSASNASCGPYFNYQNKFGVTLRVGEIYTLSAWMSVDKNAGYDISYGMAESHQLIASYGIVTTGWTRVWVTFKALANNSNVCFYTSNRDVGYVYLIGLKLEYGNKPTDWSPAPEDVCAMTDDGNGNVTIGIY